LVFFPQFVLLSVLKLHPLDFKFECLVISYIGNGGVTRRFEDSVAHREHPALAILDFQQSRLFEWEHETWRVYFDAYFVVFEVGFERF
jgi:hypothetical protein